jgi:hypothetical protein
VKKIYFSLDERQVKLLFSPIRIKSDLIKILMESIKIMIIDNNIPKEMIKGKMLLCVSKMSRVLYFSENKYFSINFPFSYADRIIQFQSIEIDNKNISDVISILEENCQSFDSFFELIMGDDYEGRSEIRVNELWKLLQHLFLFEDGYIRFDYDEERHDEKYHPLNHLDVFYSNSCTFKIGLKNKISIEDFKKILNKKEPVYYLDT